MSSTDSNEKRTVYSIIDSRIVIIGNGTNKNIHKFFDSLLHNYKIGLEQSMNSSKFIFIMF